MWHAFSIHRFFKKGTDLKEVKFLYGLQNAIKHSTTIKTVMI